jgi:hypothetical protein
VRVWGGPSLSHLLSANAPPLTALFVWRVAAEKNRNPSWRSRGRPKPRVAPFHPLDQKVAKGIESHILFREAACSRTSIANHSRTRRPRESHIQVLAPWSGPPSGWRGAAENNGTFLGGPGVTSVTQSALPGKSNDFCPVNQIISARLCHKLSLASWSGHRADCEPAMRRTHLRAAEKVSLLPLGGLFWLSPTRHPGVGVGSKIYTERLAGR